ncbi:MAG: hypothetical protein ACYC5A_08985, partial [Thermoleophilia bacterium]
ETKKLLLLHDEDQAWEFPSHFDADDMEKRARKVHSELCSHFGKLEFEDWIDNQDASFGLAIIFKPYEKKTSSIMQQPVIRFSNFGNFATFTLEELLPENARRIIIDSLNHNGFIFIDAEEIDEPYDGVMAPNESISTWWIRYFDWL